MKATTGRHNSSESKKEQADEKVVKDVDRMTTKRSHNYPKMIPNVRFDTVIYVLHN